MITSCWESSKMVAGYWLLGNASPWSRHVEHCLNRLFGKHIEWKSALDREQITTAKHPLVLSSEPSRYRELRIRISSFLVPCSIFTLKCVSMQVPPFPPTPFNSLKLYRTKPQKRIERKKGTLRIAAIVASLRSQHSAFPSHPGTKAPSFCSPLSFFYYFC